MRRRLLRFRDVRDEDDFDIPTVVIRSLKHNEVYQIPERKGLDCAAMFELLELWFEDLSDGAVSAHELCEELQKLFHDNPQVGFVKHLQELNLSPNEQMITSFFCHKLLNDDDDDIRFNQIEDMFDNRSDFNAAKAKLRRGEHRLQTKKVIEHRCVDGLADVTRYKLTDSAKRSLLAEMSICETEEKLADQLDCTFLRTFSDR